MAMIYLEGSGEKYGVAKNEALGMDFLRRAAGQGLALAQTELGKRYALGHGTPKNLAAAVHWLRQAVEQGDLGCNHL
jgi:hypothetical protein